MDSTPALILFYWNLLHWFILIFSHSILFFCLFNTLRFVRIGSVVLALHDASDVFLEIAKMSKYSGAESIAFFAFVLFVLCFTMLRIVYYPFLVLQSTRFVSLFHLLKFPTFASVVPDLGELSNMCNYFKGWSECFLLFIL